MIARFLPSKPHCLGFVGTHMRQVPGHDLPVPVKDVCGQKRGHRGRCDDPERPYVPPTRFQRLRRKAWFWGVSHPLQRLVCLTGLHGKVGVRNSDGTSEQVCLMCMFRRLRKTAP